MIYIAKYYTQHIEAGLAYAGRDAEGEEQWIGDRKRWERLTKIEKQNETNLESR